MRRIIPNFCYHLAKAHIQRIQAKASFYYRQSVLSSPKAYLTLAHHRKRTSKPYECFLHRYSPTEHLRCNAPTNGYGFCGLKSPSQADSHGFYRPKPTEADRSTKNTSEMSDAFCVSLTSN